MEAVIRLLPDADADGAANMASDEVLVRSAAQGIASLRFYGWTTATVSLGYFQPAAVRLADPRLAALPWVRRPSGGATLVHHHELTYALALPPGSPWHTAEPWMRRMHRIIAQALEKLGLAGKIEAAPQQPIKLGDILCFQQHTPGDLLCSGNKVVGSAQRKYHQAVLQHGSILLAQSEHTPMLPGIQELTGVVLSAASIQQELLRAYRDETGWQLECVDWTAEQKAQREALMVQKYGESWWNAKR